MFFQLFALQWDESRPEIFPIPFLFLFAYYVKHETYHNLS